jgi:hypothetical protein
MLGSPLALFLALQSSAPGGVEREDDAADAARGVAALLASGAPSCARVVNLLHPHDPVAYRLEPLLQPAAAGLRPALVPYHRNSGRRLGVEVTDRLEALSSSIRGVGALSAAALAKLGLGFRGVDDAAPAGAAGALSGEDAAAARALLTRLAGEGGLDAEGAPRVDWQLQAAEIEVPFFQAFTAHLAYWTDPDVALFVLRACGPAPDVPPLPAVPGAQPRASGGA